MGMVFCRGCGKEIHESAPSCPHCGALQKVVSVSVPSDDIPDGVRGWSWGAFLLNWIWAIGNKTWIGLIALIPYVGFIMAIVLGIKGREWAWKNKEWESVEHFNRVQRKWSAWGVGLVVGGMLLGIVAAISIPAYFSYTQRAAEAQQQAEQARLEADRIEQEAKQEMDRLAAQVVSQETAPAQEPAVATGDFAPSFDCAKAATGAERLICSSRELSEADVRLSQAYKMAIARGADQQMLREEQNEWRRFERDACSTQVCMLDAYNQRYLDLSGY